MLCLREANLKQTTKKNRVFMKIEIKNKFYSIKHNCLKKIKLKCNDDDPFFFVTCLHILYTSYQCNDIVIKIIIVQFSCYSRKSARSNL